eukprot:4227089-Pleurochrysis_carterae.AAC.1
MVCSPTDMSTTNLSGARCAIACERGATRATETVEMWRAGRRSPRYESTKRNVCSHACKRRTTEGGKQKAAVYFGWEKQDKSGVQEARYFRQKYVAPLPDANVVHGYWVLILVNAPRSGTRADRCLHTRADRCLHTRTDRCLHTRTALRPPARARVRTQGSESMGCVPTRVHVGGRRGRGQSALASAVAATTHAHDACARRRPGQANLTARDKERFIEAEGDKRRWRSGCREGRRMKAKRGERRERESGKQGWKKGKT